MTSAEWPKPAQVANSTWAGAMLTQSSVLVIRFRHYFTHCNCKSLIHHASFNHPRCILESAGASELHLFSRNRVLHCRTPNAADGEWLFQIQKSQRNFNLISTKVTLQVSPFKGTIASASCSNFSTEESLGAIWIKPLDFYSTCLL